MMRMVATRRSQITGSLSANKYRYLSLFSIGVLFVQFDSCLGVASQTQTPIRLQGIVVLTQIDM